MAAHFVTRLLLLEDNPGDARLVQSRLADAAPGVFDITCVDRVAAALAAMDADRFDVILSDLTLPDSDRLATVKTLIANSPAVPLVVLTALKDEALGEAAILLGAQDYLFKDDASGARIARKLRYAIDRHVLECRLRDANTTLEHCVAERTAELQGTLAQLSESLANARALAETASDAIITAGEDGAIVGWNPAAERMFGYAESEVLGQPMTLLMPDRYRDAHRAGFARVQAAGDGRVAGGAIELHGVTKAGTEFPLELTLSTWTSASGMRFVGIIRDISARQQASAERAELREQLAQSQKMESIGLLAGGVAHDFNNMLSAILGYAELTMQTLGRDHASYEDVEEIRKAAQRSADLTRQLLAFARKQTIQMRVLDLNEAVDGILKMLRRLLGEHVTIAWAPDSMLWAIAADPTQIDQVLANLAVNAKDAASGREVLLEVSTRNVVLDARFVASHRDARVGDFVRLRLRDNGSGMDAPTLSRIFEPFFTTKEQGAGTGLGLSTVSGIVQQHGGFIDVESAPGMGTTFNVYFSRHRD